MKFENLLPSFTSKSEIEQVEQERQEYNLIGSFLKTKGMKLFAFNPRSKEVTEVIPLVKEIVNLILDPIHGLIPEDSILGEVEVDTRNIHFEAVSMRTAKVRVDKYLSGKLVGDLCNLRDPKKVEKLKLFI